MEHMWKIENAARFCIIHEPVQFNVAKLSSAIHCLVDAMDASEPLAQLISCGNKLYFVSVYGSL